MRKNIFICIIFAVSISACTEEIDKEVNIKVSSSLNDLSENEALAIAKTFHGSVTFESRTRESNIAFDTKSIYRLHASEKTRALSNEELPLIYEIVVNDGLKNGKIIVSGDKRCPEVLAYMPSFDDSLYKVSAGPNIMVQMAKNSLLDKIQKYKSSSSIRSSPVESVPGEVSVMIVPFCSTCWSEYAPYNQLLPEAFIERYERVFPNKLGGALYGNYPTGQAPIAIAQAMAYLKPDLNIDGKYINWNELTMEEEVTGANENMVASLLKYIYNTIGTHPIWGESYNHDKWTATGPSTEIVKSVIAMETPILGISKAINSSQCGISCDKDQKWNLDVVRKSLISFYPVLAGDLNRVAFLVDGYAINEQNTLYLHCNFGRAERFNGYYMVYDDASIVFEPGGYFYRDITLGIIANIRNR